MCTPGALDIFREVRLYTTLWGRDRTGGDRRAMSPWRAQGWGGDHWVGLGPGCFQALCGCEVHWSPARVPSALLASWDRWNQLPQPPDPAAPGKVAASPVGAQGGLAGLEHMAGTWGRDRQSSSHSLVFPNNPTVLPFFSACAKSWPGGGEGREILGRSLPQGAPMVELDGTWCYRSSSQLPLAGRC